MKLYALLKQDGTERTTVCITEDINKIRRSIVSDLTPNEDFPEFEIWKDGERVSYTSGNDVLKKVAHEINIVNQ